MPPQGQTLPQAGEFGSRLDALVKRMAELGHPVRIISKKRDAKQQAELYQKGRRGKPGEAIVTEKSGAPGDESKHQTEEAADLDFVGKDKPWDVLGREAKLSGLEWGGDWKTLVDRPHVQIRTVRYAPKGAQAQSVLDPASVRVTNAPAGPPAPRAPGVMAQVGAAARNLLTGEPRSAAAAPVEVQPPVRRGRQTNIELPPPPPEPTAPVRAGRQTDIQLAAAPPPPAPPPVLTSRMGTPGAAERDAIPKQIASLAISGSGKPGALRTFAPGLEPDMPATPAEAIPPGGAATYIELARAVRDVHPGAFDDASDDEISRAVLDLHPELVGEFAPPPAKIPRARTVLPPPPPPDQLSGMAATKERPLLTDPASGGVPLEGTHSLFGPGVKKAGIGAVRLATGASSEGGRANAVADILEGSMEAALPVIGAAMALNPALLPEVVLGTLVGVGADRATEQVLEKLGYSQQHPGRARLIRLGVGLATGGYTDMKVRSTKRALQQELSSLGKITEGDFLGPPSPSQTGKVLPGGTTGPPAPYTAGDYLEMAGEQGRLAPTDFVPVAGGPPTPPKLLPAAGSASRQGVIRVYPSDANPQLEVTGGSPVIAAGGRLADPPPPPIDQLTEQLGAALGRPVANVPRLSSEKGLRLTPYEGPPLPPQAQPLPLRLDKRRKQPAIQGIGTDKISTSPGGAPPTLEQPRLADIPPPPVPKLVEASPSSGVTYNRLDRRVRSGLQWIKNELGEFQFRDEFYRHTIDDPEAQWNPREAGAPVYHDILQVAGHDATRAEVEAAIQGGIVGAALTGVQENIFIAAQRIGNAWIAATEAGRKSMKFIEVEALDGTKYRLQGSALLPPDAAQLPGGVSWLDDLAEKLESGADLSPEEIAEAAGIVGGAPDGPPLPADHPLNMHRPLNKWVPIRQSPADLRRAAGAAGGPPPPPQEALPGLEGVRAADQPLPEVAPAPFSLTSEASTAADAAQRPLDWTHPGADAAGNIKLSGGLLMLNVPPGDLPGLKQWLAKNAAEYGDEPWFAKAQAAVAAGEGMKAWRFAAAASARSMAAGAAARDERVQQYSASQAFAEGIGRVKNVPSAGSPGGRIDVVQPPPVPPDLAGKGVTTGHGGILKPPPQTKSTPAAMSDRVLGRFFNQAIIEGADPSKVVRIPGNEIKDLQVTSQLAEQILLGDIPMAELEAITGKSRVEIATMFREGMSARGRELGRLGNWVQQNADDITILNEISGGSGAPPPVDRTLGVLAQNNFASDRMRALYHTIGRPVKAAMLAGQPEFSGRELSLLGGISNASIPLMISQPATAVRNLMGQTARYSIAVFDEVVSAGFAAMAGAKDEANLHWAKAMEMGKAAARPGIPNSPMAAAGESLQSIFNFTADNWQALPKNDVRRTLRLLLEQPEGADPLLTNFLGRVGSMEDDAYLKIRQSEVPVLKQGVEAINAFLDPKVQNKFTALNRWQEFSTRAPIFDAQLRAHMTAAGFDPDVLLRLDGPTLRSTVGARNFDRWMVDATTTALDYTFASPTLPGSIPDTILKIFGDLPAFKIGYPFPRFDIVATMRFLYDHSPVALVDNVFRGIPYAFGGRPRTRLQMGMVAKDIAEKYIPELDQKLVTQQDRFGGAIQSLHEAHGNVKRLVADSRRLAAEGTPEEMQTALELERSYLEQARQRAEALKGAVDRQQQQPGMLPDTLGADAEALAKATAEVQQHRSLVTTLERRIANRVEKPLPPAEELKVSLEDAMAQVNQRSQEAKDAQRAIRWLEIQQGWLEKGYRDYKAIGAPTLPEFMGRQAVGTLGLFGGAYAIRSSQGAEGTEWFQYRLGEGENATIVDLRPFGPYVQSLFVADVVRDHQLHTDWQKVTEEVEGLDNINPFAWADAIRNNYDGRYSNTKLGREFAHAFLTISRAAGVTLTMTDFASRWVTGQATGVTAFTDMVLGTVGQMLARATIPLRPVKDLLSVAFPEEATVRIPDRPSEEQPYSPLAAPLQNVPFAGRLIPPSVSQITGEELRSKNPIGRQFAGLSTTQQTALQRVFTELGVLPESIYIHRTGDKGLDDLIAKEYSNQLKTNPAFQSIFEPGGPFMSISSIGLKREVMSSVLSGLKQLTIFNVRQTMGVEATQDKFQSPAQRQRIQRWQAELDRMQAQAEAGGPGSQAPPEFEPSVPDGPPAPPQQ